MNRVLYCAACVLLEWTSRDEYESWGDYFYGVAICWLQAVGALALIIALFAIPPFLSWYLIAPGGNQYHQDGNQIALVALLFYVVEIILITFGWQTKHKCDVLAEMEEEDAKDLAIIREQQLAFIPDDATPQQIQIILDEYRHNRDLEIDQQIIEAREEAIKRGDL